jgi:hypothetical protein
MIKRQIYGQMHMRKRCKDRGIQEREISGDEESMRKIEKERNMERET